MKALILGLVAALSWGLPAQAEPVDPGLSPAEARHFERFMDRWIAFERLVARKNWVAAKRALAALDARDVDRFTASAAEVLRTVPVDTIVGQLMPIEGTVGSRITDDQGIPGVVAVLENPVHHQPMTVFISGDPHPLITGGGVTMIARIKGVMNFVDDDHVTVTTPWLEYVWPLWRDN